MENLGSCEKSGFMVTGVGKKGFKSRYLRLYANGKLLIFKDGASPKPINSINIRRNRHWNENVLPKKPFCIKIEQHPDPVFLVATNAESIRQWTRSLESVGGIRCKYEVGLPRPFSPVRNWSKETVEKWLSSTYFSDGENFFSVLQEHFLGVSGKKLVKLDASFFSPTSDNNRNKKVLSESEISEIMKEIDYLQRRNIFDYGEAVVFRKIQNIISHIPSRQRSEFDLHVIARALSDPDILIETFLDIFVDENSLVPLFLGRKKRHRSWKKVRERVRKKKEKEERTKRKKGRKHQSATSSKKLDTRSAEEIELMYYDSIQRGDECRMPIILFFYENIAFEEVNSIAKIFCPVLDNVPPFQKDLSGIKPALIFGPWLLHWNDSGLIIPRRISNKSSSVMNRIAMDMREHQKGYRDAAPVHTVPESKDETKERAQKQGKVYKGIESSKKAMKVLCQKHDMCFHGDGDGCRKAQKLLEKMPKNSEAADDMLNAVFGKVERMKPLSENEYKKMVQILISNHMKVLVDLKLLSSSEAKSYQQKMEKFKLEKKKIKDEMWKKFREKRDLRLKNFTYQEIVSKLSQLICKWNRSRIDVDGEGYAKLRNYLPKFSNKLYFEGPGGHKRKSSLWGSASETKSIFQSSAEKDFKLGDSFRFIESVLQTFNVDNYFDELVIMNAGEELERGDQGGECGKAGDLKLHFRPTMEDELQTFHGRSKKLKNFWDENHEPIVFKTHQELDDLVAELVKTNRHFSGDVKFRDVRTLLLLYDRIFWMRNCLFPDDPRYKPGERCPLNEPITWQNRPPPSMMDDQSFFSFFKNIDWGDIKTIESVVKTDGMQLRSVENGLNDNKSVVLWAIKQNARALKFTSERLKSDSDIVKFCVGQDGLTIRYTPEFCTKEKDNKAKRKIRTIAVKENGEALRYLKAFNDEESLVSLAVQQNGIAIQYASERLKGNEKIGLMAVQNNAKAYKYLSEELQDTKKIVVETVRSDYQYLISEVHNETFREDIDVIRVFLWGCIGEFSDILLEDLKVKFGKTLAIEIFAAKARGEFLIEKPYESLVFQNVGDDEEIVYVGFCNKEQEADGFGFELLKLNKKQQKKKLKKRRTTFIPMHSSTDHEKRFVGHYVNGLRHGTGRLYHENVIVFEGQYEKGRRHGRGEYYDVKTGLVQKGHWVNGMLDEEDQSSSSYPIIQYAQVVESHIKDSIRVGTGGYGSVYVMPSSIFKGFFSVKEEKVAVKIMLTNPGIHDRILFRMTKRGISLISSIPDRQNVLDIYAVIRGKNCCGYCMKLCDQSVHSIIAAAAAAASASGTPVNSPTSEKEKNTFDSLRDMMKGKGAMGKMSMKEKIRILYETAKGMRSLHSNLIMHRDLKWENVLLDFEGNANIIDFESLKEDEVSWKLQFCSQTSKIGTQGFLAPEVYVGKKYSLKCDVYAYGLMIYALLWDMNFPYQTQYQCGACGAMMKEITRSRQLDRHVANCNLRPLLNPSEIQDFCNDGLQYLIDIMITCWDSLPYNRPSFDEIVFRFECEQKKSFFSINFQFPQFKDVIKEQKLYLTKPYHVKKIRDWIERKKFEGSKLISLKHSRFGVVKTDEDLEKLHDQVEGQVTLVVKLDQVNEEEILNFYADTTPPNAGETPRTVEEEKKMEQKKKEWKEKYEKERLARKQMEEMILQQMQMVQKTGQNEQMMKMLEMQLKMIQQGGLTTPMSTPNSGSLDLPFLEEETEGEEAN